MEITGGTGVLAESGDGPLDIANSAKSVTQIPQLHRRSDEHSHGLLAGSNRDRIDQRMQNPVAQSSSPHGGYRAVERSHERHGATRPRDDQLEMPLRGGVEQQVIGVTMDTERTQMGGIAPQRAGQVVKKGTRSSNAARDLPDTKSIEGMHLEM